jgi:hypothetical protein
MKFCQPHWEALRKAVADRGMDHLVAKSGQEAAERTKSEIEDGPQPANFDPLMRLHWMISGRVLEGFGLYLMLGDYCPMCEAGKHCEKCREEVETWPDSAADAVKEEYDRQIGGRA